MTQERSSDVPSSSDTGAKPAITNVDQLRHAIDQGETADKVRASDPAAAPLGTDAEAGGVSPTLAEIELDAASLNRRHVGRRKDSGFLIYAVTLSIVSAVILGIVATA